MVVYMVVCGCIMPLYNLCIHYYFTQQFNNKAASKLSKYDAFYMELNFNVSFKYILNLKRYYNLDGEISN